MSNYKDHAMTEFRAAGWMNDSGFNNELQEMICNHVLKLLEVFADEGHSGSSAPYAINMFKKLAAFEPLAPLTGEDWEWIEVSNGFFQNKRCSHVFKENGKAYDTKGKVFVEPDGCSYTNKESMVYITFPYTPRTEYLKVEAKSISIKNS